METLPIEVAQVVYKLSCRDAFESLPLEAWKFRMKSFGELFDIHIHTYLKDFFIAFSKIREKFCTREVTYQNEYVHNRLAEMCLLNAHHKKVASFQRIIRSLHKKLKKDSPYLPIIGVLEKLFYSGPFTIGFFVVREVYPMDVKHIATIKKSILQMHFGNHLDEWHLIFTNGCPAIIKNTGKHNDEWEIQSENQETIDLILEIVTN